MESLDKAKQVVGETYYIFLEVKIALVLSILLIKNYGGYGDEENIEYMMICRISFQICFEHQLKRLGFKIYLQKLVLAIWEFHLIQTARMKDIASPSKDSHQVAFHLQMTNLKNFAD